MKKEIIKKLENKIKELNFNTNNIIKIESDKNLILISEDGLIDINKENGSMFIAMKDKIECINENDFTIFCQDRSNKI